MTNPAVVIYTRTAIGTEFFNMTLIVCTLVVIRIFSGFDIASLGIDSRV